jgi:hypothetical protein
VRKTKTHRDTDRQAKIDRQRHTVRDTITQRQTQTISNLHEY